jgi:hypothetical protein
MKKLVVDSGKVEVMTAACQWETLDYCLCKQHNSTQVGSAPCYVLYTQKAKKVRGEIVEAYEVVFVRYEKYTEWKGVIRRLPEAVRDGLRVGGEGELWRMYHSTGCLLLANPDATAPHRASQPGHPLFKAMAKFLR